MLAPAHPLIRSFLRDARWSPTTVRSALEKLNRWSRWCDARPLALVEATRADCEDFLDELAGRGLAPATIRIDWRMLRAFYRWAALEGEVDRDPMVRIKGPRITETPVKVLADGEYRRLVDTCNRRSIDGRRDEAILSLLWWSGLRRSEVVNLDLDGLDLDRRFLTVGSRSFATKTGKVRRIPLAGETVAALDRYLRQRGDEPGPLFLSQRGDTHAERRLAPNSLTEMLRRRARAAELGRLVGAHEFRRAMAVRHKARGGSEDGLMAIAGWKDARMVGRYTRMNREDLAADEFHRLIDTSHASARRRGRRIA